MDFQVSREQELVRKLVRAFAEREVKPLAAEVDAQHRFPAETVAKLKRYGFTGMIVPKSLGGAGADEIAYAIAVEELSRVCATTGVIVSAHNSLALWPLLRFGTEEQKERYLRPLADGRKLGAFALTEPNAGTDAAGQQTCAVLDSGEWVLTGTKIFITNGGEADTYVVFAMTDRTKGTRGISAFVVERPAPGFSIGKVESKMGIRGSSTAELVFDGLRLPKEALLGKPGEGFKIAMATLDGGRIGIAAQALGIAQGALDESVKYTRQREQFGKPIAKQQALQFMMADMETRVQAARHLVYHAAWCKASGRPYGKEAAMAKLFASETAMWVTERSVQLHGGYGYTSDYPVERMMRDAKITEIYEGTSEVQRMVVSAALLK